MRKRIVSAVALAAAVVTFMPNAARADRATPVLGGAIWVDGELYGTVLTDTSFSAPPSQSVDVIYSFMMSGLAGQRSVAEVAPGDPEYNGGRWSVQMVVFTQAGLEAFDGNGDGAVDPGAELTSAEDVELYAGMGLLEIIPTGIYFECPLLPRRG